MIGPRLIHSPGVYDAVSAELYHRDPVEGGSLSSSGARALLPPNTPAHYRHRADNPQPSKKHFDRGSAAHRLVLGVGPDIEVVDAEDWRTKAAKEQAAAARAAGRVPLLRKDFDVVTAMAEGLRRHPVAAALFAPGTGLPEQTLIWRDRPTGVWCRARLDWLPQLWSGRLIIPDYKTAHAADTDSFERAMATFGYPVQAEWYRDGVRTLRLAHDPAFVFVVQEVEPPHLVHVFEPDIDALRLARTQIADARRVFAACVAADQWPGYSTEVELAALPAYAQARIELTHAMERFSMPTPATSLEDA